MSQGREGTEERHIAASRGGMESLGEALAWAVNTFDREFTGSQMVKIAVEQIMSSGTDPDDPWVTTWTAAVSGMTEVTVS